MHRDRHPEYVPGCFNCKALTIGIAAEAMPSRKGPVVAINEKQARWDRDGAALERLAADGIVPRHNDGCADLEQRAETKFEAESGHLLTAKQRREFNAIVQTTGHMEESK